VAREAMTGWVVPVSAAGIASALETALSMSSQERSGMGIRAAADIRARFTLDRMKSDTLAVYDRLLGTTMAARRAD
jgi:glycosyltransferase involved in cell wall biosynthesis